MEKFEEGERIFISSYSKANNITFPAILTLNGTELTIEHGKLKKKINLNFLQVFFLNTNLKIRHPKIKALIIHNENEYEPIF